MKKKYVSVKKNEEMLCGPACLYYISNHLYNLQDVQIPSKLTWIADLANFASSKLKLDVILSCYNSRLYDDFRNASEPYNFEGFTALSNYISTTSKDIVTQKVSTSTIVNYLKEGYFILLNVSSAIFNKNPAMTGGHFILILDYEKSFFKIANPLSNNIEIQNVPKHLVVKASKNFGNWMLCLKQK